MDKETLLARITTALEAVTAPRFYESERGYQGALLGELKRVIPEHLLPADTIIEQEYQKRLKTHGLNIRPDIIIHDPFDAEPIDHDRTAILP